jgi:NAD(P)-dependent dehydrogenase (short-subunit alcohol dehydrogenase family)
MVAVQEMTGSESNLNSTPTLSLLQHRDRGQDDGAEPEAAWHDLHSGQRDRGRRRSGPAARRRHPRVEDVLAAVAKAVETFGGIDIPVNNANAISLTDTEGTPMQRYDLMNGINARGLNHGEVRHGHVNLLAIFNQLG